MQRSLRLYRKSFEAHDPPFLVVHCNHVVLCPCALELHPEDLDGTISCLLHRIDDFFVLALEACAFDLLYTVASNKFLEVVCM